MNYVDLADEQLVERVKDGEDAALGALYDRHCRHAYSLALRMVRDRAAAEDVVHDVFLGLWRAAWSFRPERGRFQSWLLAAVHNRATDELRRRTRRASRERRPDESPPVDTVAARTVGPEDASSAQQIGTVIREALAALPQNQRDVLTSAYFEGLSQSEIAERFKTPLGTVKTWTRAALLRLREALKGHGL